MRLKTKFLVGSVVIAATITAAFFYSKYRVAPRLEFQMLSLTDLNNRPVSLDSFKGKNLFVGFFATWCGPCIRELPSLEAAKLQLTENNFQFVLISDEPIEELIQLQQHISIAILHSNIKLSQLGVNTIPTSYVLNTEGKIVFKKTGEADWASDGTLAKIRTAVR